MRATYRPLGATLALALCCLPAAAQAPPPAPTPPPAPAASPTAAAVAATVNGQPIYETQVQPALEGAPADQREKRRQAILDQLIDNALIDQHLLQLQVQVDKAEVDKKVDEMKEMLKKDGKDFAKMLEVLKLSEGQLREHVWADLRWNKFAAAQATDKALRELFDGNKEIFDGSTVHARHILLMPPAGDGKAAAAAVAQLQAIKKQIADQVAAGLTKLPADADALAREKARAALTEEAFAAAARDKSACPSKAQGGDVGWFRRAGFMVEPFSRAAFALKPFEVSDVVQTPFGYHLLLVVERRPGRDVKFEDVKELAKEVFCDRLHESLAAQIRPKSRVVVNPAPKP
jgi:peptidyl-prolyl cis-trans isomerase C